MDWLPFTYKITNRPHGKRSDSDTVVRGSLPFQVREISLDVDDPVITMLNRHQPSPGDYYHSQGRKTYSPPCEMKYYRTQDGTLVRPVYFDDGTALTCGIAMAGTAPGEVKGFGDYPLVGRYGYGGDNPFYVPADDVTAPSIYRVTGDDRDVREQEALEQARGLMKCGDVYFKEVPEPVVEIQFRGMIKAKSHKEKNSYDKRGLVLKVNAGGIGEVEDDSLVFRMDEYETAYEIVYELASVSEKDEPHMFGEVYQAEGDRLEFDPYPRARALLGAGLDGLKRNGFGAATVENVEQWCGLVRMMADASTDDADLANAAQAFYDGLPEVKNRFDITRPALLGVIRRFATAEREYDPDFDLAISAPDF